MGKRGKITLYVIIISFILVSFFSFYFVLAQSSSSNTKTYNEQTKTVTIKDGATEIAKIRLNTPVVNRVIRGKDRLVAEFTIENYIDGYSDVFESMEFYDVKNNMNQFDRSFKYKYKTYYNIEVPDYETICKERIVSNGTEKYDCVQNQTGTHIEKKVRWNSFNHKTDLPEGSITLGIFTDVYAGDHVEWIPTLFSVRINEWAVWTEALNVDLIAYYTFNETAGSNLPDVVDFNNNGSLKNMEDGDWQGGKIGNALLFDGVNERVVIDNTDELNFESTTDFSIFVWITTTDEGVWIFHDRNAANDGFGLSIESNVIKFYIEDASGTVFKAGSTNVDTGSWFHVGVTVNRSGNGQLYVNGATDGASFDVSSIGNISNTPWNLTFAASMSGASAYAGKLDELGIWARVLSASEISDLYNSGSGITYSPSDSIPPTTTTPTIIPSSPTSSQNLECNATLTDDKQTSLTAFWKWYKNDASYLSGSTSVTNGTDTLITTLASGNTSKGENWTCEVKPFDGTNYGTAKNSTSVTILNSAPNHNNPTLTTISGKNLSTEDLICTNQSTSDADNDVITNIYNWYKNSQPLTVLNLPFEINADDYSGNNNDGTISGATFTNGKVGQALSFDGIDDYVSISDSSSLDGMSELTIEGWLKLDSLTSEQNPIGKDQSGGRSYGLMLVNDEIRLFVFNSSGGERNRQTTSANLVAGEWYHIATTLSANDAIKIYVNGIDKATEIINGLDAEIDIIQNTNTELDIGRRSHSGAEGYFNGTIDEVKIYNHALTSEQISNNYNLNYNTIVSQETTAEDTYQCQVTPNDAEVDGTTLNSSSLNVLYAITFNVTSGDDYSYITDFGISCNNSWSVTGVNSPYETGFLPGSYECTFSRPLDYYDKTITFTADNDKIINVKMSVKAYLTVEEHTWLEAIYNCLYSGDCSLYNLLLEVNQTVSNIWEHTAPTDESVVIFENVTNKVVDNSNNLTIDYTVSIPIKAGYSLGAYLPVRIGYWFLDTNNESCYNQGDKPTGVEDPYCQPLIIETLGPMGGSVNFTVELQPSLPTGNYSIKRIIDIDPLGVWYNYGQETIGIFLVTETLTESGISLETTGEIMPNTNNQQQSSQESSSGSSESTTTIIKEKEIIKLVSEDKKQTPSEDDGVIHLNKPRITGGVIGSLLEGKNFIIILGVFMGIFILIVVSKIKGKRNRKVY